MLLTVRQTLSSFAHTNGGAVYGSRSYDDPQGETTDGLQVRTTRKDDSLAVVVVGNPKGRRLTVKVWSWPTPAAHCWRPAVR
jgi:hypothetical protein